MNQPLQHNPTFELARELRAVISADATWTQLAGGKTNRSWRVTGSGFDHVCKLYPSANKNPLFPNNPHDEFRILCALQESWFTPPAVSLHRTRLGDCVVYEYVSGQPHTRRDSREVGRALREVHRIPSNLNLRELPTQPLAIIEHGERILESCSGSSVDRLSELKPQIPQLPHVSPVLLHGDLVPANIIQTPSFPVFIDWQCPAYGDPCEDISTFLSPAMRVAYSSFPITDDMIDDFLSAYGDGRISDRYYALAPLYHWRMAAYCLWKSQHGSHEYQAGYDAEIDALRHYF
ncbi:phosphotransferase family protein [Falsihalocynthiibacter sp. SS001]|uniref:phosphotransferase family protein n=1 Tax=Falsihalocynthiibacter sp. SS001 TaxID=3349698 RepID=UPI0036D22F03